MNWEIIAIYFVVFIFATLLFFSFLILVAENSYFKKQAIKKRLLCMSSGSWHGQEKINLYRQNTLDQANCFVKIASSLPRLKKLNKIILAAGLEINPWSVVLFSILSGIFGITVGVLFQKNLLGMEIMMGILFAFLPYFYLLVKANKLKQKILEQFPEALDLLSRALRSGHAFTSAMAMVSEQMDTPIKDEFGAVVDEINFGLSHKEALLNMCERKPLPDLRFFAVAVLIQSETGGNIAEIMDNIGRILRERIQFKRQLKTLTAEGKISAIILLALPVLMFFYLYASNYEYISLLWRDQIGKYLLAGGILLQILGTIIIRRMVDIEV